MTIKIGEQLPPVAVYMMRDGHVEMCDTADLFQSKTILLIGIPGAFTPLCHGTHIPGYLRHKDAFYQKGIDALIVIAPNDAYVMQAWAKDLGAGDQIPFLADSAGHFAKATGLTLDLSEKGLGMRMQRFAMIIKNGTLTHFALEPNPSKLTISRAEDLLVALA